ncbi:amine oxidase [Backusella circina FSU 941]|nr:amine oxidase [Backusella circina FSU 941]
MYFNAIDYHKTKKISKRSNASKKDKKIGIVGAGMSGLFSGYLLDQAGFSNYEILEANDRLGGRIHTTYFGKSDTAYQEMGPMHIPFERKYKNQILPVTDHRIVFHLADELNALNDESYKIEFIKWYQSRPNNLYYKNGFRLPDGSIPTVGEVQANPSLDSSIAATSSLASAVSNATSEIFNEEWHNLMTGDFYGAFQKAMDKGYDSWSGTSWLYNKMGISSNATDYGADHSVPGFPTFGITSIWSSMYIDFYSSAGIDWRTVQGGFNRLAQAFEPVLGKKIQFGISVSKIDYDGKKVSLQWKKSPYDTEYESEKYDNVIVAVPFSIVRSWHLPELDYTLRRAINNLSYDQACGCDSTDLLVGSICYPANNIGTKGPGVVLASYASGDKGLRFASMTEDQHVARVIEDFTELHGANVKKYYTGKYDRRCWILDPFQSGSWAQALPGQRTLFMPSYYNIDNGLIFVGEHTDIKHAWISAALESSIRGVTMILVENGHIDEAKNIIEKYNATWIAI